MLRLYTERAGRVGKYHDIFENIKLSKISIKIMNFFDIFDIFQKMKNF